MATTTTSNLNSLYPNIYEDAIFVAREMNLMAALVYNYEGGTMATRYMGIRPQVTAQTKAEGVDFANPTTFGINTKMELTPSTAFAQVVVTDEDVMTDPSDVQQSAARELGGAIATKVDVDLLGLFSSFTTGKGTANAALTIKLVAAGIAVLRNAKAPSPINVVLHPYGWFDVWVELGQPAATYDFLGEVANQALRDYAVGAWIGARWFQNANISVDSSDDAYSGVFHGDALALDTRRRPTMEVERDASKLADEVNMHMMYGVGIRRDEFGVYLLHDAAEPTGS